MHFPICVRSGFCCKRSTCAFGTWDREKHQCEHLQVVDTLPNGAEIHACGIHDWITQQRGNEVNPAFGSGCCSPLFNHLRDAVLDNFRTPK